MVCVDIGLQKLALWLQTETYIWICQTTLWHAKLLSTHQQVHYCRHDNQIRNLPPMQAAEFWGT